MHHKNNAKRERKYVLGACELFPETPVLVNFTKFSIFSDQKTATLRDSKSATNASSKISVYFPLQSCFDWVANEN